jgi:hypothetical protein
MTGQGLEVERIALEAWWGMDIDTNIVCGVLMVGAGVRCVMNVTTSNNSLSVKIP